MIRAAGSALALAASLVTGVTASPPGNPPARYWVDVFGCGSPATREVIESPYPDLAEAVSDYGRAAYRQGRRPGLIALIRIRKVTGPRTSVLVAHHSRTCG